MKKYLIALFTVIVVLVPYAVLAQVNALPPPGAQAAPGAPTVVPAPPPGQGFLPGMVPYFNPLPWLGTGRTIYSDELWRFAGSVAPGHEWINMTFNFPFSAGNTLNFESMNLKLNSEPFWVGFVGAEAQLVQDWIVYGRAGANIPRNAEMVMDATGKALLPADPGNPALDSPPNLTPPWMWTAKNFQWWMLEGGVLHAITSTCAVEAGFRVEHFDFELTDPRNFTTALPGAAGGGRPITRAITCPRI